MKPYCEIVVQVVLPSLRALVAKELMDKHKLNQSQVSKKLGVSQAAISQYRRDIRGYRVKLLQKDPEIIKEIENISSTIASKDYNSGMLNMSVCNICKLIRKNKIICKLHKEAASNIDDCNCCCV